MWALTCAKRGAYELDVRGIWFLGDSHEYYNEGALSSQAWSKYKQGPGMAQQGWPTRKKLLRQRAGVTSAWRPSVVYIMRTTKRRTLPTVGSVRSAGASWELISHFWCHNRMLRLLWKQNGAIFLAMQRRKYRIP